MYKRVNICTYTYYRHNATHIDKLYTFTVQTYKDRLNMESKFFLRFGGKIIYYA